MLDKLRQGKVMVRNWHARAWGTSEKLVKKKGVDKRGAKSDEAYVREVLAEMAGSSNIVVLNDEAHHAWRAAVQSKTKSLSKEEEEATVWVGGLDRIHRARGILNCFDFSATPFVPSASLKWVMSDISSTCGSAFRRVQAAR